MTELETEVAEQEAEEQLETEEISEVAEVPEAIDAADTIFIKLAYPVSFLTNKTK